MGNIIRHGVDMYKQTMNSNDAAQQLPQELIRTVQETNESELKESKYRRVAKFLIIIGSEQAAGILSELDPDQVSAISKEIALIKTISPEERIEVLEEFKNLFARLSSAQTGFVKTGFAETGFAGSSSGGIETARRILYAAKGAEKGEALLNKAVPESKESAFSFLEDFSPEQIVMLLKGESDQTAAMILTRLSSKLSAGTLSKLPPKSKPEVLRRMAHQGEVMPEVLQQVAEAFKEKVRHVSGGAKDVEIDGMQRLAAILKQGDYSFGDRLINELEAEDPKIGKDLKEKLYTLDDIINTVDRPIQEKLAMMSESEIAILLKGRSKEFSEKILSCVSAGRRQVIREEFEVLGAVSKRDCDAAAKEFLSWFRLARERGEIILYSDEDVVL
ncbi:MAG: flagellar motor switch protein FliG [Treponema sp.]|nr:flagellar motor switch protein FliG [Treponema sp.]MCL2251024.1 flagellar motor switch protein FliG [Treponema sp.]